MSLPPNGGAHLSVLIIYQYLGHSHVLLHSSVGVYNSLDLWTNLDLWTTEVPRNYGVSSL